MTECVEDRPIVCGVCVLRIQRPEQRHPCRKFHGCFSLNCSGILRRRGEVFTGQRRKCGGHREKREANIISWRRVRGRWLSECKQATGRFEVAPRLDRTKAAERAGNEKELGRAHDRHSFLLFDVSSSGATRFFFCRFI